MKILLASRSPQRRELLARLGVSFSVEVPEVEELRVGDPAEAVLGNAERKARAIERPPEALVIGCDTEVVLDGEVLGKPGEEGSARRFLGSLSGRSHEVLSGLSLLGPAPEQLRSGVASSRVTFRELGEGEIEAYLRSGEWRDRAGGYAVQGLGSTLIARVEGDLSNVIGLPLALLLELAPELLGGS